MKILSLKILSDFRNLNGIELQFDPSSQTNVLIGNNGSGKSNILEAISCIFKTLYSRSTHFEFSFFLQYEINSNRVCINYKKENNTITYTVNATEVASVAQYLPSRVVCNYSGEDNRLYEEDYKKPFEDYTSSIIKNEAYNPLRMIFINKDLWGIVLLVMLAFKDENTYKEFNRFLTDVIGLNTVDHIILKEDKKVLKSWEKNPNAILQYFQSLINQRDAHNSVDLKYFKVNSATPQEMFIALLGCKSAIAQLKIYYNQGIDAQLLSEGEKKFMVILFILEALSDESSLVLMDEPDSHIHVSRKEKLKEVFDAISNRDNIITSHSPTLTAKFDEKSIIMLERNDKGLSCTIDEDKKQIVDRLTNGMWTLQEQNIFLTSKKNILLVEGITDISYLKAALKVFHTQNRFTTMDFEFIPCHGAKSFKDFNDKFTPKQNQVLIAVWDYDNAGKSAQEELFKKEKNKGKPIKPKNFGKARKLGNIWYTFYPKMKGIEDFNVEDYFPRNCKMHYIMRGKSINNICTKETFKKELSKDCDEGNINDKHFKHFETVLSLFEEILQAEKDGQKKI